MPWCLVKVYHFVDAEDSSTYGFSWGLTAILISQALAIARYEAIAYPLTDTQRRHSMQHISVVVSTVTLLS